MKEHNHLILFFTKIFGLLCKPFSNNKLYSVLFSFTKAIEERWNSYVTYAELPKRANDINYIGITASSDIGIILQGPIIEKDDFTIETIRLYEKIFSNAKIIVSTWDDICKSIKKILEDEGVIVVLNDKPRYPGTYNINYQVVSTMGGLLKAKELGCKYCMKTRADQRIYRANLIQYISALQIQFPLSQNAIEGQHERIFFYEGNHPSSLLIPYEICDFFFFGRTEDLISYFDIQLLEVKWTLDSYHNYIDYAMENGINGEEYHANVAPEVLLMKDYLKRHNALENDVPSMDNYWNVVSSSFLALSFEDLELYWYKNVSRSNNSLFRNIFKREVTKESKYYNYVWSYRNWLSIYSGTFDLPENIKFISKLPLLQTNLL